MTRRKVAIWLRVSSDDQRVDSQRLPVQRYVKARGWLVVAKFIEEGVGGAAQYRKMVDDILQGARRKHFDTVVIFRGDRSFRTAGKGCLFIDELIRHWMRLRQCGGWNRHLDAGGRADGENGDFDGRMGAKGDPGSCPSRHRRSTETRGASRPSPSRGRRAPCPQDHGGRRRPASDGAQAQAVSSNPRSCPGEASQWWRKNPTQNQACETAKISVNVDRGFGGACVPRRSRRPTAPSLTTTTGSSSPACGETAGHRRPTASASGFRRASSTARRGTAASSRSLTASPTSR